MEFTAVYQRCFREVVRWLHAFGAPDADLDDLAQEVFLVVRRKLPAFDGQNLAGWLYRIARNTYSDHRRRAWFKHLVTRRQEIDMDRVLEPAPSPANVLETKRDYQLARTLLARIPEPRRTTFVLFEIEGYSGEEIAHIQEVPINTVWTRIHHARKQFLAMVAELGEAGR